MDRKRRAGTIKSKAAWVVPIVLGVLFGLCSHVMQNDGELRVRSLALWVMCLTFPAAFCLLFWVCERIVARGTSRGALQGNGFVTRLRRLLPLEWRARNVLVAAAVIFLLWTPYLIALYPGVVWFDTSSQIVGFTRPEPVSLHHPLFVTVLLGSVVNGAGEILGDPLFGVFALVLTQSVLVSLALSLEVCYLSRLDAPWGARLASLAFCALFPGLPCFFATLVKDTLCAPFFILYCVALQEVVRTRMRSLRNPLWSATLVLSAVLMCLTKKASAEFVLLSAILVLACLGFVLGRSVVREGVPVVVLASCIVVALVVPGLLASAFEAVDGRQTVPSGKQEPMALAMQIVANAVQQEPTFFSEEERDVIDKTYLMGFDGIQGAYLWQSADGVKQYSEAPEANYRALGKVCLKVIALRPRMALEAWCGLNCGWFAFSPTQDLVYSFDSGHSDDGYRQFVRGRTSTLAGGEMVELRDVAGSLPILGVLMRKCVWAAIIPALCVYLVMRSGKGRRAALIGLAALSTLLLSVAMLIVSPVSVGGTEGIRYVAPMMCVAPLWLAMAARFLEWSQAACDDDRGVATGVRGGHLA